MFAMEITLTSFSLLVWSHSFQHQIPLRDTYFWLFYKFKQKYGISPCYYNVLFPTFIDCLTIWFLFLFLFSMFFSLKMNRHRIIELTLKTRCFLQCQVVIYQLRLWLFYFFKKSSDNFFNWHCIFLLYLANNEFHWVSIFNF